MVAHLSVKIPPIYAKHLWNRSMLPNPLQLYTDKKIMNAYMIQFGGGERWRTKTRRQPKSFLMTKRGEGWGQLWWPLMTFEFFPHCCLNNTKVFVRSHCNSDCIHHFIGLFLPEANPDWLVDNYVSKQRIGSFWQDLRMQRMFFLFTVFNCGLNTQRHPLKKEVGKSLKFGRKKRRMWTRRTMFGKWDNSLLWQGNVVRYIKLSKTWQRVITNPSPILEGNIFYTSS